jgi:hypothetical protein
MATQYSATTDSTAGSSASIRSWAGQIEATFLGGGWVQTTDTGQTAAASLVSTGVTDTPIGYEIFKMADALQATYPVFVKIEYGPGAATSSPGLWFTIGTGSNGSGSITGVLLPQSYIHNAGYGGSVSSPSWGSASTNRISFVFGPYSSRFMFSIERSKNGDGTDSGDGLLVLIECCQGSGAASYQIFQYLRFINNTLPNSTYIGGFTPSGSTWADGSNFGVSPISFFNGMPSNPCLNWLMYLNGDTAAQVSVPVNIYGTTYTYMPFGSAFVAYALGSGAGTGNVNASLMMLWE